MLYSTNRLKPQCAILCIKLNTNNLFVLNCSYFVLTYKTATDNASCKISTILSFMHEKESNGFGDLAIEKSTQMLL